MNITRVNLLIAIFSLASIARADSTPVETVTNFVTLDVPGGIQTTPAGVSGNIVVGSYPDASFEPHGFIYNGSTYNTLDVPGATETTANAISGNTIVGTYTVGTAFHGFLYNDSTCTTLDFPGASDTYASGISGNNIVGYYVSASTHHGFLYNGSTYYYSANLSSIYRPEFLSI